MQILLILVLSLVIGTCKPFLYSTYPKAKNGVLDLREWSFQPSSNQSVNGVIPLDGEWEFYWQKLLFPEDFKKENLPVQTSIIKLPKAWNEQVGHGDGYATYRLKVLLPDNISNDIFAIRSEDQRTAYSVYVNSRLIQSSGQVGRDKLESIPRQIPTVGLIINSSRELEIVLQVSNFHHRKGGALNHLYLGSTTQIQEFVNGRRGIDFFVTGIILIIALYHFIYWTIRRKDLIPLVFTLFCISVLFRSLLIGEHLFEEVFPNLDYHAVRLLKFNIIYWTAPFGTHFFNLLFPNRFAKFSNKLNYSFAIFFTVFSLLAPVRMLTFTGVIYQIIVSLLTIYILILILYFVLQKHEYAIISLLGYSIFAVSAINDILNMSETIDTRPFLTIGMIPMVFSQAVVLSLKSAKAFVEKEELSKTLDQKVMIRTSELEFERQKAFKRMIEFEKYNEAFTNLAKSHAIASGNFRKALEEITQISANVLQIQRSSVWRYERKTSVIRLIDLFDSQEKKHKEGTEFYEKDYPSYLGFIKEAKVLEIEDIYTSPITSELLETYILPNNISSILNVPIWFGGYLFGILSFEHTESARKWTLEESNFASSIASLVSNALESHEKHLAQIKEIWVKAEIEILNDITVNLVESPSLDDALMFIFDHLMKTYNIELLVLYFIEDNSNSAFPYKARGNRIREEIFEFIKTTKSSLESGNSFFNKIIKRKKVTTLSSIRIDRIQSEWELSFVSRFGVKSIFAMPILVRGDIVGMFVAYNFQESLKFSRSQLESISRFGNQIAGVIHKGKILEETKKQKKEIEKLAESRKRLSVVGEMSSGIVHDIKNPMSTIKAFSSMARNPDLPVTQRNEYMDLIEREIDRLSDMTFEILDFSKGKIFFNFDYYNAKEFLQDVYNFLKIDFEYAGIQFLVESDYEGLLPIDRDRIRRVIVNLANNAREAMTEYKKNYEFKIHLSKTKDMFVFCLSDNGPGLPDSIEGRIFEAFATEGKVGGTGLGLFMSKWIIEQHGGNLTFTSEKDKGTSFFISLPDNMQRMED